MEPKSIAFTHFAIPLKMEVGLEPTLVLVALPTELPLRIGRRIRTFGIQVKREIDIRLSSILYCIQHNTMKPYRSFHQGLFLLFFSFLFRKIVVPIFRDNILVQRTFVFVLTIQR
jgi:hypothetical protein